MKAQIDHPSYYNKGIEVIDFIECYGLNFNLGNVVKYVARAGYKDIADKQDDLMKALWYLEREVEKNGSKTID